MNYNFDHTNDDEDCAIGKKWFRVNKYCFYMNLQLYIMHKKPRLVIFRTMEIEIISNIPLRNSMHKNDEEKKGFNEVMEQKTVRTFL